MTDTPETPSNATFCQALPDNPTADHADANTAMPRSLSKELGDYAEGDYAVSAVTQDAPSMDESDFNDTVKSSL